LSVKIQFSSIHVRDVKYTLINCSDFRHVMAPYKLSHYYYSPQVTNDERARVLFSGASRVVCGSVYLFVTQTCPIYFLDQKFQFRGGCACCASHCRFSYYSSCY